MNPDFYLFCMPVVQMLIILSCFSSLSFNKEYMFPQQLGLIAMSRRGNATNFLTNLPFMPFVSVSIYMLGKE